MKREGKRPRCDIKRCRKEADYHCVWGDWLFADSQWRDSAHFCAKHYKTDAPKIGDAPCTSVNHLRPIIIPKAHLSPAQRTSIPNHPEGGK